MFALALSSASVQMAAHVNLSRRIEIPSSFNELEAIVDAAEVFFRSCFEDDEKIYAGILLTSEAVTNAIEHGNAFDESKKVIIEFKKTDSGAELWVEDEGAGFERSAVADPLAEEHLFDDGGRGLFLIEKMADKVLYEKGGRRVGIILSS